LTGNDAGMNDLVCGIDPGIVRRRIALRCRTVRRRNRDPIVRTQLQRPFVTFHEYQCLRETLSLERVFRICHLHDNRGPVPHAQHDSGDVFALNIAVNLVRLAVQTCGFTEQKARNIKNVAAQVHQNEPV